MQLQKWQNHQQTNIPTTVHYASCPARVLPRQWQPGQLAVFAFHVEPGYWLMNHQPMSNLTHPLLTCQEQLRNGRIHFLAKLNKTSDLFWIKIWGAVHKRWFPSSLKRTEPSNVSLLAICRDNRGSILVLLWMMSPQYFLMHSIHSWLIRFGYLQPLLIFLILQSCSCDTLR